MTQELSAPKKKTPKIFYFILVLLPVVILLMLEFGLRAFNYGASYPLFIPVPQEQYADYLRPNPHILKRYFSDPTQAPQIAPESLLFKKAKGKNTIRIVVQGGSTAAGFPYGISGSLAVQIKQRFKRLYPNKEIEIVSTAMAAINSYMMLDFVEEIIAIEPDLVLIYAGHNEYLGILGVGSGFTSSAGHATNLLFLKLKDLRVVQLVQQLLSSFQMSENNALDSNSGPPENRSLMARAAKERNIAFDSDLYHAGIAQFRDNLKLILDQYREAKIPVFVSTLASNEKDQPPFSSEPGANNAADYFAKAKQFEMDGRYDEALAHYQLARDHDLLRFRAPSIFNQLIREQTDGDTVFLVDSEQHLRNKSSRGIIGDEMMLEHLHPNRTGYFLLADAFTNKIVQEHIIIEPIQAVNDELAFRDNPIGRVTNLLGEYTVKLLKADYPFVTEKQEVTLGPATSFDAKRALDLLNKRNWLEVHLAMLDHYYQQRDDAEAAKIAALISDSYVMMADIAATAGNLYMFIDQPMMALRYHKRALAVEPDNVAYLMDAVGSRIMTGNLKESLTILNKVISLDPDNHIAVQQRARLLQLMKQ